MFESLVEAILNVVLSPLLWLSVGLALACSTLFSIWRWAGVRQLGRDLGLGVVGFGFGHIIGVLVGLAWMRVGQVQCFWGLIGALVALSVGRRIGLQRPPHVANSRR